MKLEDIKEDQFDIVIIGGGITGAGILRESVRMGISALLTERNDFAWGTSSRSSKLVHGGLRYLKQGKILLTLDSVRARERLIKEAPGLVEPLEFLMPVYSGRVPGKAVVGMGLALYSLLALKWQHRFYNSDTFAQHIPFIEKKGLVGGFRFFDAQVDDARLVLRTIFDAVSNGGTALNYTAATEIFRNTHGEVTGIMLEDTETGIRRKISTHVVINATGAWAEELHRSPNRLHLRPLKGSHLIFPVSKIPIQHAISFVHHADNRPIFVIPWEGAVIFGTTDVDFGEKLSKEPVINEQEIEYLMTGLNSVFPSLNIKIEDCIATMSGIRPVLSSGGRDPSKESREHVVWADKGLITITGGKLTTFRKLSADALKKAMSFLPKVRSLKLNEPAFENCSYLCKEMVMKSEFQRRLFGRYGNAAQTILESASPQDLTTIPGTLTLWAEIPYAAANEHIRHLCDLMLRRIRIGILTPHGGKEYLPKIQALCAPVLPWNENRWKEEITQYLKHWHHAHSIAW